MPQNVSGCNSISGFKANLDRRSGNSVAILDYADLRFPNVTVLGALVVVVMVMRNYVSDDVVGNNVNCVSIN